MEEIRFLGTEIEMFCEQMLNKLTKIQRKIQNLIFYPKVIK